MKAIETYIQEEFRRELEDTSPIKIKYPSADAFAKIVKELDFTGNDLILFPRSRGGNRRLTTILCMSDFYRDRLTAAYNRAWLENEAKMKSKKEKTTLKPIPNEANKKRANRKAIYQTIIREIGGN